MIADCVAFPEMMYSSTNLCCLNDNLAMFHHPFR
nr:MAG TPA: hypothetical protein [Caudoviricetes sp.]